MGKNPSDKSGNKGPVAKNIYRIWYELKNGVWKQKSAWVKE